MNNEAEKVFELEKKIVEIITDGIALNLEEEIFSWSDEEIEKAMKYIESDDFPDENLNRAILNLAVIVYDDIKEKTGMISY